jgi:hypothetical protein
VLGHRRYVYVFVALAFDYASDELEGRSPFFTNGTIDLSIHRMRNGRDDQPMRTGDRVAAMLIALATLLMGAAFQRVVTPHAPTPQHPATNIHAEPFP